MKIITGACGISIWDVPGIISSGFYLPFKILTLKIENPEIDAFVLYTLKSIETGIWLKVQALQAWGLYPWKPQKMTQENRPTPQSHPLTSDLLPWYVPMPQWWPIKKSFGFFEWKNWSLEDWVNQFAKLSKVQLGFESIPSPHSVFISACDPRRETRDRRAGKEGSQTFWWSWVCNSLTTEDEHQLPPKIRRWRKL